jgi:ABC-type multidrug transport system fused ATPase/permease subunit
MQESVTTSSRPPSPSATASQAHVLGRLLRIAWEYRGRCCAVLAIQLLLLAVTVAGLGWSGIALDVLHHALSPSAAAPRFPWGWSPPPRLSAFDLVLAIAAAVVVMGLARAWLSYAYTIAVADLVQGRLVPTIRAQVYEKLQHLSFRFYDQHASGSLLNRVTSDVQSLRSFIDAVLIQALVVLLALGTFGSYMASKHAGLTAVCLASTPLLWLLTTRFSRRVIPAYDRSRGRLDELVLGVSETVLGMPVIKSFAAERSVTAELRVKNARLRDSQREIFRQVSRYTPSVDLLIHFNLVILLAYGGVLVVSGRLTLGDLVVFAGLLQQLSTHVTTLSTIVNTLQESLIGARRVFQVLDTPTEIAGPHSPRSLEVVRGEVRFEDVSFGYDPARPALSNLSFEVQPGECIALYGAAGAGKSTLLSLIPRFYDPSRGRVLVDGIDVRELDLEQLRRTVAVVFQETFLFSHTIAANIAFGQPDATELQIEQAARQASAHEFIERLPQGYQTVLGELGTNLSGGQRQRLAIARALLTDPAILLLDDPTAALDAETTREILGSLQLAARGRTTLMVTHRPALLRRADRILVLDRGLIVQHGHHADLASVAGPYRELLGLERDSLPVPASPREERAG